MNMELKKFMKSITLVLFPFLFLVYTWDVSVAFGRKPDPKLNHYSVETNWGADRFKVLSVLENRMGDRKLIEKAEKKLLTLSGKKTHLIATLSERIANSEDTPGTDIAFLLIIALIVLS